MQPEPRPLASLLEAIETPKKEREALEEKKREIESKLEPLRDDLDQAHERHIKALAAFELGEATEVDVAEARTNRNDLEARLTGLEYAVEILDKRLEEADAKILRSYRDAVRAVAGIAREMADTKFRRMQELARELGRTASLWHRLDAMARGNETFVSGPEQLERTQLAELLAESHVYCEQGALVIDNRTECRSHFMTFATFIELATSAGYHLERDEEPTEPESTEAAE